MLDDLKAMLENFFRISRKGEKPLDPLNGYTVGKGYELLISKQAKIGEWSICQICLEVVENRTKSLPDAYWCCPECASEAIELQYMPLHTYLSKNTSESLKGKLQDWQQKENIVPSYKMLREQRLQKLIELSCGT